MYESFIPTHLTDPLWQRLAKSKIFITGGTGLFGHWLLDGLSDANRRMNLEIEATVLTRNPEKAIAKMPSLDRRIKFIEGRVENFDLPSENFDFIFHMATTSAEETFSGVVQSQKLTMLYEGTQRVIELAQKSRVKRVLFTSSGAVYGNQICDGIQESSLTCVDSLKAESSLALGKAVAEFLIKRAFEETKLEVVIARCFSFVGPGMPLNLHYAIGNFVKNVLDETPLIIKGDGKAIRSYMHMGDLIWWLLKLILDGDSGEAYNVGSAESVSILELAERVKRITKSNQKIIVQGITNYSIGVPDRSIYVPSIDKMFAKFNLLIQKDLDKSIKEVFDHFNHINQ
jgi:UDP-glucuronate decarboxylase